MKNIVTRQQHPNALELKQFFETVFTQIEDIKNFSNDKNQSLNEWFSIREMINYMSNGLLAEARLDNGQLVGALFIGKQHPLSWLDGKKMEIFILGVDKKFRFQGIAKQLVVFAEKFAIDQKSKKIMVNTHIVMESVHQFYKKIGYKKMGVLADYYDNGDAVFFQKTLE
jgi:ribosomal protein S18 acetylase RimI-like enzyme